MKYYFKLLVLLIIGILPINIYAYELTCDDGAQEKDNSFTCRVVGESTSYDKLSGTITSDDILSCEIKNVADGLQKSPLSTNSYFDLTGSTPNENLLEISCTVIDNPVNTTNARVSIEDFTYHKLNSGIDEQNEILRSDYIKIDAKEEENAIETKPRNVSDPALRLRRLASPDLNITFSQFITEYNVEVLFDVEEVNFDYELNDPTSSVSFQGNTKLQVGKNVIDIYITTANGEKQACYTFNISRLARGEEIYYKESDSTLESMVIPGYSIGFDKNIFEYKIHLASDVDSININTKTTFENAIVSISQTDNLKNGTVIAVEVTSADETSKTTYKIHITKDAPKKDYSSLIIIILLVLAFIGAIVIFILTLQKKKDDPLLKLKNDKRKINKGKKFDDSVVPITESKATPVESATQVGTTLNLNESNTVVPIQTEKVVLASFNQTSGVQETTNLTTSVSPIPVDENAQPSIMNEVSQANNSYTLQNASNQAAASIQEEQQLKTLEGTNNQTQVNDDQNQNINQ